MKAYNLFEESKKELQSVKNIWVQRKAPIYLESVFLIAGGVEKKKNNHQFSW